MSTNRVSFATVLLALVLAGPRIVGTGSLLSDVPPAEIATVAPSVDEPGTKGPDAPPPDELSFTKTLVSEYLESTSLWVWIRTAADAIEGFLREAADLVGIDGPQRNMAGRCS